MSTHLLSLLLIYLININKNIVTKLLYKTFIMVVKLYGQVTAACPQRVLLCFLEKEIEFEIVHVDLDTLEQKKPEHLLRQVNC